MSEQFKFEDNKNENMEASAIRSRLENYPNKELISQYIELFLSESK